MLVCGIDEAGRGPVIGPMVMAGILIGESDISKLKALGVRDSKELIRSKREELFRQILSVVKDYKIISLTPDMIDDSLNDPVMNLNKLEAETSASILNILRPGKAYIDLPDRNPGRYSKYIRARLDNKKIIIVAEHKADVIYPVVSAASILAKVTRDRYIDLLKNQVGEDFGSGYPHDPKTQIFLHKYWDDKSVHFFRKSWASWKNVKKEKEQMRLFDF